MPTEHVLLLIGCVGMSWAFLKTVGKGGELWKCSTRLLN